MMLNQKLLFLSYHSFLLVLLGKHLSRMVNGIEWNIRGVIKTSNYLQKELVTSLLFSSELLGLKENLLILSHQMIVSLGEKAP